MWYHPKTGGLSKWQSARKVFDKTTQWKASSLFLFILWHCLHSNPCPQVHCLLPEKKTIGGVYVDFNIKTWTVAEPSKLCQFLQPKRMFIYRRKPIAYVYIFTNLGHSKIPHNLFTFTTIFTHRNMVCFLRKAWRNTGDCIHKPWPSRSSHSLYQSLCLRTHCSWPSEVEKRSAHEHFHKLWPQLSIQTLSCQLCPPLPKSQGLHRTSLLHWLQPKWKQLKTTLATQWFHHALPVEISLHRSLWPCSRFQPEVHQN